EISDSIIHELDSIISTEKKLRQARAAISVTRNVSSLIAPISSLPGEIMLRIFRLVFGAESYTFAAEVDVGRLPRQSLAISQVCSRWRQISLGSQHLWSQVDLSSSSQLSGQLVSRGVLFATRAGDIPLDIRLVEQLFTIDKYADYFQGLHPFFVAVGSRVGSWELCFTKRYFGGYVPDILNECLKHSAPGKLTRFILKFRANADSESDDDTVSEDSSDEAFLRPSDAKRYDVYVVDLTDPQLEDLLFPVTVLKLDKIFPYWTSKAYHGLVELRLVSWERARDSIRIPEQHLAGILRSSPGLRILQFGLEITSTGVSQPPVSLRSLEELHLQVDGGQSQQTFLRLLLPGSNPMQVFIEYTLTKDDPRFPSSSEDEFQCFLRRSNIIQLYLDAHHLRLHLPTFLQLLPDLEILILRHLTLDTVDSAPVLPSHGTLTHPKLHTVHFLFGAIHLDGFRWMCDTYNSQLRQVTTYHSVIEIGQEPRPYGSEYAHLLQAIFPTLEILGSYKSAFQVEGWDDLTAVRYA
ncbi:hypothetical protein FRC11_014442, partial [Ceratobasidium sp. 423]